MIRVVVREKNVDEALRKFKKQVLKDGILSKLKEKEFYVKPGVRKRQAKLASIRARKKREKKAMRVKYY